MNRPLFRLFGVVLVLGVGVRLASCGSSGTAPVPTSPGPAQVPATPSANSVTIIIPVDSTGKGAAAYGLNPLIVQKGATVTWVNSDSMPHTATSTTGIWDSSILNTGQSYSYTFSNSGTFPYICTIHGAASMSGTIQVIGSQ